MRRMVPAGAQPWRKLYCRHCDALLVATEDGDKACLCPPEPDCINAESDDEERGDCAWCEPESELEFEQ